jgi:hypothetical protein
MLSKNHAGGRARLNIGIMLKGIVVMRLARVHCARDQQDPQINALVATAELDLLEIDYSWRFFGCLRTGRL